MDHCTGTEFSRSTATATQREFDFARSCIPGSVREHGLRDAHHRPLVGRRYRRRDEERDRFWSGRTGPDRAWGYPYLELARTGSSYPALVIDCDDEASLLDGALQRLPLPSWATWHGDRGCHVVWCLADPVHRYPEASPRPLQALARVEAYYVLAAGADPTFVGVLADNPIAPDTGRVTRWGVRAPYSLAELADVIPSGWRRPPRAVAAVGRNCALFESAMKWAGRWANRDLPVLDVAVEANQRDFDVPLPWGEVRDTAASVERYRAVWRAHGWHCPRWLERQASRGRRGGRASGRSRRSSTAERDAEIVAAVRDGEAMRSVARAHVLAASTVLRIVQRERQQQLSLFDSDCSQLPSRGVALAQRR